MQRNNGEATGVDKILELNLWCEELKLNVLLHAGTWTAVLKIQYLFSYWGTQ